MGLDDLVNKAKSVLGDEEKTDQVLDKGAEFAKGKISGQDDKIDQGRDFLDDKLGEKGK